MAGSSKTIDNLMQELRRGVVVIGVLAQLREPRYGYALVQRLTDRGMAIEQNTLYPLLRRLEKQGVLEASWSVDEPRPRKYYQLTPEGVETLSALEEEWRDLNRVVASLLAEEGGEEDA